MIGLPRAHFRVTDSTSDRVRVLAHGGAPHGTLVTAGEQTAGRGREGRRWEAPPDRALLMSVLLRDLDPAAILLPLLVAVAVCEGAEAAAGVPCRVKWPNDIWVDGRKAAGILVETRPADGWAIVGIGLNVETRAAELPEGATSLALEAARPPRVEDALAAVLDSLEEALALPRGEVLERVRARDALCGRRVTWADGDGRATGVGDAGELLVDTAEGLVGLASGEVHLRLEGT